MQFCAEKIGNSDLKENLPKAKGNWFSHKPMKETALLMTEGIINLKSSNF